MGNLCVLRSVRPSGPSSILGKQKHALAHFGTCNNTCCAISVSVFTADEGVATAAAADTAAAAVDPDDSGTVGGIVPMG